MLAGELIDQLAAKPFQLRVGQADRPCHRALAQRSQAGGVVRIGGHTAFLEQLSQHGLGEAARSARPGNATRSSRAGARPRFRSRSARRPGGGSSSVFKKGVGRFVVHVVHVVDDGHFPHAPGRLQAEIWRTGRE